MKSIFSLISMIMMTSTSFAANFTATGTETLYYYQPNTAEAAEAKMWISALAHCKKTVQFSNYLPIKISNVITKTDQSFMVTASAQFKCVSAEGREL